jgi:hypothetical protein
VLLTRSRLCPRPKPGSSLHLHVLGTPPAFVLSQDQTLREELLGERPEPPTVHKESSGKYQPAARGRDRGHGPEWRANPGPIPGGIRPSRPHEEAPCTQRASGRKTRSILAPPTRRPGERIERATASNLDTHLDRGVGRRVRMLLSFQRPSHHFWKGFLLRGASGNRVRIPERTDEYSARSAGL